MKKNLILFVVMIIVLPSFGQEISQWRGENRDGIYTGENLLEKWPENGPELIWYTTELPKGNASISIKDGIIYTTGLMDSLDACMAIDANSGQLIWQTPYGRNWKYSFPESRCTPTINDGKLYVTSGLGDIACLDAKTGEILWNVKGYESFSIRYHLWGIAESPIVVDDKVIFNPIGPKTTTVALDKNTGEIIWESESIGDSAAYVSPILVETGDNKMIINESASELYAVSIADGTLLWRTRTYDINTPTWHQNAPIINCNTPVYASGQVYATSGYNHTGAKFQLTDNGNGIELIWSDTVLDTHHGGVVKVGDYIYGSNWVNNGFGNWCCIDWNSGKKMWEEKWHTKGSIIAINDRLILYDEKSGNVGMAKASPDKFEIISEFKVPYGKGPHWSHPVVADGILYIRHMEALMAYKITDN